MDRSGLYHLSLSYVSQKMSLSYVSQKISRPFGIFGDAKVNDSFVLKLISPDCLFYTPVVQRVRSVSISFVFLQAQLQDGSLYDNVRIVRIMMLAKSDGRV